MVTTKARGQKVGYIRVSAIDQNTDRQLQFVELNRVFIDKASGKDTSRPELKLMLDFVREGDTVIVHSMDRLARNLDDLRKIVFSLTDRGIKVQFTKENLIFSNEENGISKLMLSIMGAIAEFERSMIKERQREGIELAKKRGVYKGRKRVLTKEQVSEARKRMFSGEKQKDIAKDFNVNRVTLYNYIKAEQENSK